MTPTRKEADMKKGKYVIISGVSGSGKSTAIKRLREENVFPGAVFVREPGQTPLGEAIRAILLNPDIGGHMTPEQEFLFFTAARIDVIENIVQPARRTGHHVLSDRGWTETWTHQWWTGMGRKDLFRFLSEIERYKIPFPDVWGLLDLDPAIGLARQQKAAGESRIHQLPLAHHQKVCEGFQFLFDHAPFPHFMVDASLDQETVYQDLKRQLLPFLKY